MDDDVDEILWICNSVQLGLGATLRKETTKMRKRSWLLRHYSHANEKLNRKCAIVGLRNRTWSAKNSGHGSDDGAAGIDKN
jgi:hypothetical protein